MPLKMVMSWLLQQGVDKFWVHFSPAKHDSLKELADVLHVSQSSALSTRGTSLNLRSADFKASY